MSRAAPDPGAAPHVPEPPVAGGPDEGASGEGVSREAGFTVLETLIAFVILVGLTAAMLQIAQGSFSIAGRSEQLLEAAEIARGALARIGADIPVEEGLTEYREGPVAVSIALSAYDPDRAEGFEGEPEALIAEVTAVHDRGGRPVTLTSIVVTEPEPF